MLNWFKARVTEEDVRAILQICNLYNHNKLLKDITTFCLTKYITLTRGDKTFEEMFNCNEPEGNPILIVSMASLH